MTVFGYLNFISVDFDDFITPMSRSFFASIERRIYQTTDSF